MVWLEMKELAYFLWYGMVWYGFPTDGKERGTCQLWTFFVLTQHVGGVRHGAGGGSVKMKIQEKM